MKLHPTVVILLSVAMVVFGGMFVTLAIVGKLSEVQVATGMTGFLGIITTITAAITPSLGKTDIQGTVHSETTTEIKPGDKT